LINALVIDKFEAKFGSAPRALSRLIRPMLIAGPGNTLVWSDWSAIEARVLPWLAGTPGQHRLELFESCDADPNLPGLYEIAAGDIYAVDPAKVSKEERQVGKVAELALGFGGGVGALASMAAAYGLSLDAALTNRVVDTWRKNNKWATNFWSQLGEAFQNARRSPNSQFKAGRVTFVYRPKYLFGTMFMFLPCGRALTYPALKTDRVVTEDEYGDELVEYKLRYQSGHTRTTMWHGILAENVTQATAASLLRDAIRRCENNNMWIDLVGHTHDELIAECPEDRADNVKAELTAEMEYVPDWAEGLPLAAETTENWFYSKAV